MGLYFFLKIVLLMWLLCCLFRKSYKSNLYWHMHKLIQKCFAETTLASPGHRDDSRLFPWWLSWRGHSFPGSTLWLVGDSSLQDRLSLLKLVRLNTSPRYPVGILQRAVEPLHRVLGQHNQFQFL